MPAVINEADPSLTPKRELYKLIIWIVVLVGLFAVAVISILVGVDLENNNAGSGAILFAVPPAVVTGLFGLLAKGPTQT